MSDINHNIAYTDDDIITDEGLTSFRRNPAQFAKDTEWGGLTQQIYEPYDNGGDEALLKGSAGFVDILICLDSVNSTYQAIVRDNGRGVPFGKMVDSFTRKDTSGKYKKGAYVVSSGQFGVGGKFTVATAKYFRALSRRLHANKPGDPLTDKIASLYVNQGNHTGTLDITSASRVTTRAEVVTGTYVVLEPDPEIYTGIDTYAAGGYQQVLQRLQRYCYFKPVRSRFYIYSNGIDPNFWSMSNVEAFNYLESLFNGSVTSITFDSLTFNKEEWAKAQTGIVKPIAWSMTMSKQISMLDDEDKLGYNIFMIHGQDDKNGGYIGIVNSVPIDSPGSNHISVLEEILRQEIAKRCSDHGNDVKRFITSDYKLPIGVVVEVAYKGAKLSGTTKDRFISADFREIYSHLLQLAFKRTEASSIMDQLVVLITEDILDAYNKAQGGQRKSTQSDNRLFLKLNKHDAWRDCTTPDRSQAELFLVEGGSAGRARRNSLFQAVLELQGKPKNVIEHSQNHRDRIKAIMEDRKLADLTVVSGINPHRPDIKDSRYGLYIAMVDADSHGAHIASLLSGYFWSLCPDIILKGMFFITIPPKYGLIYKGRGGGVKKMIYMRDSQAIMDWMCDNVYKNGLDIYITLEPMFKKPELLTGSDYNGFVELVKNVGLVIDNLSKELVIPPMVLEMLALITHYLHHGNVNVNVILQRTGADRIQYDPINHILTLTYGSEDKPIALHNVAGRIYKELLPMMRGIGWTNSVSPDKPDLGIYVTSKGVNVYQQTPVSLYQLYMLINQFDKDYIIEQFKGIGQMNVETAYTTMMDPKNRTLAQVTSVGDPNVFEKLLGSDSSGRKELLVGKIANGSFV